MIQLHSIESPRDKTKHLEQFKARSQTWLVSDLPSKMEIQKHLLAQGKVLEEDAVLRATELWKKFLLRLKPEMRIVSSSLALVLIRQWLSEEDIPWAKAPGTPQRLYNYINQFLPIFSHPQGEEMLNSWLLKNSGSLVRWGPWFKLSSKIWSCFLKQEIIPSAWICGVLVNEPELPNVWQRELVVDLNSELSGVESDIIKQISKNISVDVFVPDPKWKQQYFSSLWAYSLLQGKSLYQDYNRELQFLPLKSSADLSFKKYSTSVTEVKAVTAQIRKWLDQGISPSHIGILAPDIEYCWPTLSSYLENEGIPFKKDQLCRLQSYPQVVYWLARLRLNLGLVSSADLELSLYTGQQTYEMNVENFYSLFSKIYDDHDLQRDVDVEKLFQKKLNGSQFF